MAAPIGPPVATEAGAAHGAQKRAQCLVGRLAPCASATMPPNPAALRAAPPNR